MIPILFSIGDLDFHTHGVFAVLGISLGTAATYYLARPKLSCTYLADNMIYALLIGIAGARLTYFLLYSDQFSSWKQLFYLWEGGLVSYGGFAAGGVAFFLLNRFLRQPALAWLDVLAVGWPLGLAIGRFGEFLAGENLGVVSAGPLAIANRVPIHLFEAVWCGTIFLLLWFAYRQPGRHRQQGVISAASIALYASGRFIIDFWREDSNIVFNLSLGQVTSLTLLVFALGCLLFLARRKPEGKYVCN
ncbi:MAG: prolipoprotein diacylglyceryl transferase [Patescibacteria group bacterium]